MPWYNKKKEYKKKIDKDYEIDYQNELIPTSPPFVDYGKIYLSIICWNYQWNKKDYIENDLCKVGNIVFYKKSSYLVLGCFKQVTTNKDWEEYHIMVEPNINKNNEPQIQYNVNNNVSGIMNGNFIVDINKEQDLHTLVAELKNLTSNVNETNLRRELELFEYRLRLGEAKKEDVSDFIKFLEKYKNIPTYTNGIATITTLALKLFNIF